jgi:hypothetical protein
VIKIVSRTELAGKEHNRLINMMANHFRKLEYTDIKADITGYTRPDEIYGHVPDLTCRKNDVTRTLIILEAETCDTIFHEHTDGQWKTFFNEASRKKGEFHLIVPKTCDGRSGRQMANERLNQLGISATVWTPS